MLLLRFLLTLAGLTAAARATTVIPPNFDELVRESELIVRARVTAVKSVWRQSGARPVIATEVTFAIERTLRGTVGETLTLEFLGGVIGDKELRLAGWPRFEVGDRGVFFVEDRMGRACPLMRLGHGRYRIGAETGSTTERVLRDDRSPLRSVQEITAPLAETNRPRRSASSLADALTLPEFEARIVERSSALPRPGANIR